MNLKSQGYCFTLLAVTIFAIQDGISKYLGTNYSPIFITMIRYWVFGAFVVFMALRAGGLARAARTKMLGLQILRGILLATEIVIFIYALSLAGMALTQSVAQVAPLVVTVLAIPFLGEKIGWRRWIAIFIGFLGVLIILNPTDAHFDIRVLIPLAGTILYAFYAVATRAVGKTDGPTTSFFYTGVIGALMLTCVGFFYYEPIAFTDWFWVAMLCICGIASHYFLIRAYSLLEAGEVQPLTYFQLVIGTFIAVTVYNEKLTWNLIIGAIIVVAAGLFAIFRERQLKKQAD